MNTQPGETPSRFLTMVEMLTIHEILMLRYSGSGGARGLRDGGALEAALFRPQSGYYADTIAQASALFESLAMNHAFVDGNKRIAFACHDVFLRINGYRLNKLTAQSTAIYTWMIDHLDASTLRLDVIEPWVSKHTKAVIR